MSEAGSRFVDEALVRVRGGDGGSGSASFHREKYRPKGGPDGGDGGHGGSVTLVADPGVDTLAEFRLRKLFRAGSGSSGSGNHRRGRDGTEMRLPVPAGTLVRDAQTDELLADLAAPGVEFVVARGGRGGRGNAAISSSVERAPNFAERGEPGEEKQVVLDLRILADVGLLGVPNAGKSTLLRAVSAARPKVGDYPFTTLEPNLGVVEHGGDEGSGPASGRFVVADLPGLIEGAADGRGLGIRFLRHAQRCAVLALVADVSSRSAVEDLRSVLDEVRAFADELADRVAIVIANKVDLGHDDPGAVAAWASEHRLEVAEASATRGDGIEELVARLGRLVTAARASMSPAESFAVFRPVTADRIEVEPEDAGFRVRSSRAERVVATTPLDNPRAVRHLQRRLNALGVEAALARAGAQEGDEVRIGDSVFEYHPEPSGRRERARRDPK